MALKERGLKQQQQQQHVFPYVLSSLKLQGTEQTSVSY